jgi:hypothetical protein
MTGRDAYMLGMFRFVPTFIKDSLYLAIPLMLATWLQAITFSNTAVSYYAAASLMTLALVVSSYMKPDVKYSAIYANLTLLVLLAGLRLLKHESLDFSCLYIAVGILAGHSLANDLIGKISKAIKDSTDTGGVESKGCLGIIFELLLKFVFLVIAFIVIFVIGTVAFAFLASILVYLAYNNVLVHSVAGLAVAYISTSLNNNVYKKQGCYFEIIRFVYCIALYTLVYNLFGKNYIALVLAILAIIIQDHIILGVHDKLTSDISRLVHKLSVPVLFYVTAVIVSFLTCINLILLKYMNFSIEIYNVAYLVYSITLISLILYSFVFVKVGLVASNLIGLSNREKNCRDLLIKYPGLYCPNHKSRSVLTVDWLYLHVTCKVMADCHLDTGVNTVIGVVSDKFEFYTSFHPETVTV